MESETRRCGKCGDDVKFITYWRFHKQPIDYLQWLWRNIESILCISCDEMIPVSKIKRICEKCGKRISFYEFCDMRLKDGIPIVESKKVWEVKTSFKRSLLVNESVIINPLFYCCRCYEELAKTASSPLTI